MYYDNKCLIAYLDGNSYFDQNADYVENGSGKLSKYEKCDYTNDSPITCEKIERLVLLFKIIHVIVINQIRSYALNLMINKIVKKLTLMITAELMIKMNVQEMVVYMMKTMIDAIIKVKVIVPL